MLAFVQYLILFTRLKRSIINPIGDFPEFLKKCDTIPRFFCATEMFLWHRKYFLWLWKKYCVENIRLTNLLSMDKHFSKEFHLQGQPRKVFVSIQWVNLKVYSTKIYICQVSSDIHKSERRIYISSSFSCELLPLPCYEWTRKDNLPRSMIFLFAFQPDSNSKIRRKNIF